MTTDNYTEPGTNGTDFVQRFSYRSYGGKTEPRWKRVLFMAWFEMSSTWSRSTVGKVLLILVVALNGLMISIMLPLLGAQLGGMSEAKATIFVQETLIGTLTNYFSFSGPNPLALSDDPSNNGAINLGILGILVIALVGIAGSGFFADDRQGKLLEVYLSRLTREEYTAAKILGMFLYTNLFITVPLLLLNIFQIQGFGRNHLNYLGHYLLSSATAMIISLLLALAILILSTLVEKRAYASLGFFVFYFLTETFGGTLFFLDPSNEFLILVSPSNYFSLLFFVMLGRTELFVREGFGSDLSPFSLTDGTGLEVIHVLGFTLLLFLALGGFLLYKIHTLTTEEI